ncbi:hypothetical protein K438DRAFT_1946325 [Mycena galopus ATCC 62051]|nr:hypothetical protein K438DRAFT_1946325 [Mycena galopus ATCC 62051]
MQFNDRGGSTHRNSAKVVDFRGTEEILCEGRQHFTHDVRSLGVSSGVGGLVVDLKLKKLSPMPGIETYNDPQDRFACGWTENSSVWCSGLSGIHMSSPFIRETGEYEGGSAQKDTAALGPIISLDPNQQSTYQHTIVQGQTPLCVSADGKIRDTYAKDRADGAKRAGRVGATSGSEGNEALRQLGKQRMEGEEQDMRRGTARTTLMDYVGEKRNLQLQGRDDCAGVIPTAPAVMLEGKCRFGEHHPIEREVCENYWVGGECTQTHSACVRLPRRRSDNPEPASAEDEARIKPPTREERPSRNDRQSMQDTPQLPEISRYTLSHPSSTPPPLLLALTVV